MSDWNLPSWLGGKPETTVAHEAPPPPAPKGDIMPEPETSPSVPVQAQAVAPLPAGATSSSPSSSALASAAVAAAAPTPPSSAPKIKIGVLLPLTGPNAGLGHAMLNAAQQAVFDAAAPNFELMPRDTGSNEATAAEAAHSAIVNGASFFVGPLFAAQVPAVAKIAGASNIPVVTLSTDTSLEAPGVYVMGFAPGAQAERVVKYAIAHGIKRFAALVPNNAYGTLVGKAFQQEVEHDGAALVAMDTFDLTSRNNAAAIRDIADKSSGIEALFLPEGGSDLAMVTKQLQIVGVDPQKIRILGTGLWDSYDTGRVAPYVTGGWYAASDPTMRRAFVASYKSIYAEEPPRLSTLAYDATALAAALAKRGSRFDTAAMTNPNGFAGLDGIFRLKANGEVERGLAVLRVTPEGADVLDPAPTSFSGY